MVVWRAGCYRDIQARIIGGQQKKKKKKQLQLGWWPETEMVASGQVELEPGQQAASPEDTPGRRGSRPSVAMTQTQATWS